MWVAKVKFSSEGTLIGSKAHKHRVNLFGFPLAYFYEKDWVVVHAAGTILGKEVDKKRFVKALKKEKRVVNIELNKDFFICTYRDPSYAKALYSKDIIHVAPAFMSDKGYEIITVGCFTREPLNKVVGIIKKELKGALVSIQQKKIKSVSIMKVHPELTDKQKQAMELAIKHSYYSVPREIDLPTLAKMAGICYSTFQVHLRKAEQKLIPYFYE